jgi:hypothetical protein
MIDIIGLPAGALGRRLKAATMVMADAAWRARAGAGAAPAVVARVAVVAGHRRVVTVGDVTGGAAASP